MKPVKLTMTAFGPYAETQEIDFSRLHDKSIFLINGTTGAGKTTILDAMCYALYGSVSGSFRPDDSVRSDFAPIDKNTIVTFHFRIANNEYIASRSLRVREKRSGERKVEKKAEIHRLENGEEILLSSSVKDVKQTASELLGFDVDQFRQVVLLPQGEFRNLLSGTSGREEIMKKLFQTQRYEQIESYLKRSARQLSENLREHESKKLTILEGAEVDNIDTYNDQFTGTEESIEASKNILKDIHKQEKIASAELKKAEQDKRKWDEHKDATVALQIIEEQKPAIDEKQNQLENARKAQPLQSFFDGIQEREKELKQKQSEFSRLEAQTGKAKKQKETTETKLRNAEKNLDGKDEINSRIHEYKSWLTKSDELETAHKELIKLDKDVNKKKTILDQIISELNHTKENLEKAKENKHNDEKLAGQANYLADQVRQLKKVSREFKAVDGAEKKLSDASENLVELLDGVSKLEIKRDRIQSELNAKESMRNSGRAFLVAQQLEEGKPCPVCGSVDHPQPASSDVAIPNDEEIEKLKESVEKQKTKIEKENKKIAELKADKARLEQEVKNLQQNIAEYKDYDAKRLQKETRDINKELKAAEEANSRLSKFEAKINSFQKSISELEEKQRTVQQEYEVVNTKFLNQHGTVNSLEKDIPREYRDKKLLESKIEEDQKRIEKLENDYKSAQKRLQAASEKLVGLNTSIHSISADIQSRKENLDNSQKQFTTKYQAAGFQSEDDFTGALLNDKDIKTLETVISEFKEKLRSAKDQHDRTLEAVKDIPSVPDIDDFEEKYNMIVERRETVATEITRLEESLKRMKKDIDKIADLQNEINKTEAKYNVIAGLSDAANGKNQLRLRFQTFVLSVMLDDTLVMASRRMQIMSKGRFALRRDTGVQDGRKKTGLEILVEDSYTGTERPVSTLSGGESFLASLSLALGLSDVVQNFAGGVQLGTIFIDEGFGNLDPESLDLAFKALTELQEGKRLVGIISHVPDLKELIDVRIDVQGGKTGSTARIVGC